MATASSSFAGFLLILWFPAPGVSWGLFGVCLCRGLFGVGFLHLSSLEFGVFPNEVPLFHKKSCSQPSGIIYLESCESILQYSWSPRSSLIFFTFCCRGRMKQQSNIYLRSQQVSALPWAFRTFPNKLPDILLDIFSLLLGKTKASAVLSLGHFPSCSCLFSPCICSAWKVWEH